MATGQKRRMRQGITDHFAFTGTWPFGPPGRYSPGELIADMDRLGIERAYVTDFACLLHKNPMAANPAFGRRAARYGGRVLPVAVVDPSAGTVERDIETCAAAGFAAVRIAPNYHGYELSGGLAARLGRAARRCGLPVFLARYVEDPRFQHEALGAGSLTPADVAPLVAAAGGATVVLNNFAAAEADAILAAAGGKRPGKLFIDVAGFDQSFDTMESHVGRFGSRHLVFGSGVPILYPGAARMNLEGSLLPRRTVQAILARRIGYRGRLARDPGRPGSPRPEDRLT